MAADVPEIVVLLDPESAYDISQPGTSGSSTPRKKKSVAFTEGHSLDVSSDDDMQPGPQEQRARLMRRETIIYSSEDTKQVDDRIQGQSTDYFVVVALILSWILLIATLPLSLFFCLKVVKEYERAVMFRLGRLQGSGVGGPGLIFILPCIDSYRKVDLRVVSFDVPPQEILSKDSVTVSVDGVVYFRVHNPVVSVTNVNDAFYSTKLLAQTTLRNILGTKTLAEMLQEREVISHVMESVLDEATDPWGVKVERVEVKDIRLPHMLMRAMATEAEAARDARAQVIAAQGEFNASRVLKEAADVLSEPTAMQIRYLQCLASIAAERKSTIIFPLPINIFSSFSNPNAEEESDEMVAVV